MEKALGQRLQTPFDPYANSVNLLLASYVIPYVGETGYIGASPMLESSKAKRLVAGLLAVEAGQDAVLRCLLYAIKDQEVFSGLTVAEITDKISNYRNKLGHTGIVDEGLVVPKCLGAQGMVTGNILSADMNSVGYARTGEEVLRVVYGTGDAHRPGGFYPKGARGEIAESLLGTRRETQT
ncbi:hypothetical protein KP509_19G026400 [Ceratopteris richardii]|nr:hypothetical protein KP509_19G026400 [Ceratopteris richardii]